LGGFVSPGEAPANLGGIAVYADHWCRVFRSIEQPGDVFSVEGPGKMRCWASLEIEGKRGYCMTSYEFSSLAVAIVSALISLGTLVFVGLQVRHGVRATIGAERAQRHEWALRRREATLSFYLSSLAQRRHDQDVMPPSYDRLGVERFISEADEDNQKPVGCGAI
jgi:hypothetical protein